jgi:hypothetical protein
MLNVQYVFNAFIMPEAEYCFPSVFVYPIHVRPSGFELLLFVSFFSFNPYSHGVGHIGHALL